MISWLAGQNRKFFCDRSNSDLSSIFTSVDPGFSWIGVSLELLFSVILNPLVIFRFTWKGDFVHRCLLIDFILSESKKLFLTFHLAVIISKENSRSKLVINKIVQLLLSLCSLTVFTKVFNRGEIIYGFNRTDFLLNNDSFRFHHRVPLVNDCFEQILINLSHPILTQRGHDFLLFFSECCKVSGFQLFVKQIQVLPMKSFSLESILYILHVFIGNQLQQLFDFFLIKLFDDGLHVNDFTQVSSLKNLTREGE